MTYTVVRELGRGGFGTVHEVINGTGQSFAMKLFEPGADVRAAVARGAVTLDNIKSRFKREVNVQLQINSKNIVRIIDHDLAADQPWFVMELAVGTLQDDLIKDRSLDTELSSTLFDILAGLEDIHKLGIAHRDLKPVNVLKLKNDDGTFRYAISDFGLISAVGSETTTLTQTGHGGGTPIYAAPELITKFKHATPAADIYSFGAILHDIFDGNARTPYLELTTAGVCGAIIEKCTKTNPGRRYLDIAALRADIYQKLVGQTLTFTSDVEKEVVELLQRGDALTDGEWDRVYNYLNGDGITEQSRRTVFAVLTADHIKSLSVASKELLNAIGIGFSTYVRENGHNFDYRDVLADKIEALYEVSPIGLKAHCLITLLIMGVDHNRWFVERKFLRLASPYMEAHVATRIRMDIVADGVDFENYLSQFEKSISVNRNDLHPHLVKK